jgi:diguanylate cyclase (GGDEF)-like protein
LRANRASRKKSELGVMMLDVDHFKQCNDAFGYEVGDSVLRSLGNLPRTLFRAEDIVDRCGGEDFPVMLPVISPQ